MNCTQIPSGKTVAETEFILNSITSILSASRSVKKKPELVVNVEVESTDVDAAESKKIENFELKTIEAPLAHRQTKNWIIFSDLHVKR